MYLFCLVCKGCDLLCFCLLTCGFGHTVVPKAGQRFLLAAALMGGRTGVSGQVATGPFRVLTLRAGS